MSTRRPIASTSPGDSVATTKPCSGSMIASGSSTVTATTAARCQAKASSGAIRVVERSGRDDRLAAVDLDAVGVREAPLPAEDQRLAEKRRGPAPGDVA